MSVQYVSTRVLAGLSVGFIVIALVGVLVMLQTRGGRPQSQSWLTSVLAKPPAQAASKMQSATPAAAKSAPAATVDFLTKLLNLKEESNFYELVLPILKNLSDDELKKFFDVLNPSSDSESKDKAKDNDKDNDKAHFIKQIREGVDITDEQILLFLKQQNIRPPSILSTECDTSSRIKHILDLLKNNNDYKDLKLENLDVFKTQRLPLFIDFISKLKESVQKGDQSNEPNIENYKKLLKILANRNRSSDDIYKDLVSLLNIGKTPQTAKTTKHDCDPITALPSTRSDPLIRIKSDSNPDNKYVNITAFSSDESKKEFTIQVRKIKVQNEPKHYTFLKSVLKDLTPDFNPDFDLHVLFENFSNIKSIFNLQPNVKDAVKDAVTNAAKEAKAAAEAKAKTAAEANAKTAAEAAKTAAETAKTAAEANAKTAAEAAKTAAEANAKTAAEANAKTAAEKAKAANFTYEVCSLLLEIVKKAKTEDDWTRLEKLYNDLSNNELENFKNALRSPRVNFNKTWDEIKSDLNKSWIEIVEPTLKQGKQGGGMPRLRMEAWHSLVPHYGIKALRAAHLRSKWAARDKRWGGVWAVDAFLTAVGAAAYAVWNPDEGARFALEVGFDYSVTVLLAAVFLVLHHRAVETDPDGDWKDASHVWRIRRDTLTAIVALPFFGVYRMACD